MKKIYILLLALTLTVCTFASNVITYTANNQLEEISDWWPILGIVVSHSFDNGAGTIVYDREITRIGAYGFAAYSELTSINIPNSVTSIDEYAFNGCTSLTSIIIPSSVTNIGAHFCDWCTSLTSIQVEAGNPKYDSRDNSNAIIESASNTLILGCQNTVIPSSVTSIGETAFYGCENLTSISIPNTVTSIGADAFYDCPNLPVINNIRYAGSYLVEAVDKSQNTYTIKSGTRFIGNNAFKRCTSLGSLTLPGSVVQIDNNAFDGCTSLTSINIPNPVTSIGDEAFKNCSGLTSITLPDSVIRIGTNVFAGCTSLPVIGGIRYADTYLIEAVDKSLSTYSIKSDTRYIGDNAFHGCHYINSIIIPDSVTSIGSYAFQYCNISSIILPRSLTSIGTWAFYGCSDLHTVYNLSSLDIVAGAATHGWVAYYADSVYTTLPSNYSTITYKAKRQLWNPKRDAFDAAIISQTFADSIGVITFGGELTSIGKNAFFDRLELKSITLPNSVRSIGNSAFEGCSNLTSVTLPDSLRSIGNDAFSICSNLTSVTLPDSLRSIGNYAFVNCQNLASITIPNSVTSIGIGAFYGCSSLTTVTLPDSLASIENDVFQDCSGLTSITIPNSVRSIGAIAFAGCTSLTSITIPSSVTSIEHDAFVNCGELIHINIEADNTVYDGRDNCNAIIETSTNTLIAGCKNSVIPSSVTSIGYHAFRDCFNLSSIIIPNSVTSIEDNAFLNCENLKTIYNQSSLDIVAGAETHGRVAYYADTVINRFTLSLSSSDRQKGKAIAIINGDTCSGVIQVRPFSEVTLVAIPKAGYQFNNWSDGNSDNPRTITMQDTMTLTANFGVKMCSLSIVSNIEEAADITGAGVYEYGSAVTCSITLMSGYNFVKWGDGKTYNPYLFKLYEDKTLYAFFEEEGAAPFAPDTVVVTPAEDQVNIQWPQVDEAASYTLIISKGGEIVCTLTFNGLGQLTNIDFASSPARSSEESVVTVGFNFTVTGLENGTEYEFLIVAKDDMGNVIETESGSFETLVADALEDIIVPTDGARKMLHNGHVYILLNGHIYDASGRMVK